MLNLTILQLKFQLYRSVCFKKNFEVKVLGILSIINICYWSKRLGGIKGMSSCEMLNVYYKNGDR